MYRDAPVMRTCLEGGFIVLAPGHPVHDEDMCSGCGQCLACVGHGFCIADSYGCHSWIFVPKEGVSPWGKHERNQEG
jgi:ferredoxin